MSTLLLVCVFGIAPGNPGEKQVHVLTRAEVSRYSAFEQSIDDSCEECSDHYELKRRSLERSMCRSAFGKISDLQWVEARAAAKAVRS